MGRGVKLITYLHLLYIMKEWSYNPLSPYAFMACRVASLIYISRNEGYNIMCSNFGTLRAYLRDISAVPTLQLICFQKCERLEHNRLLGLLIYPVSNYYSYFLRLKKVFLRCDVGTAVRKTVRSIQRQQNDIRIHAELQTKPLSK